MNSDNPTPADVKTENTQTYVVNCHNNSNAVWTFYLFQRLPVQSNDVFSLAWLVSPFPIHPGQSTVFRWQKDYMFESGRPGPLAPGVVFLSEIYEPCDPQTNNQAKFTPPALSPAFPGGPEGYLTIQNLAGQNSGRDYAVGIGMYNHPTFITQYLPNMTVRFPAESKVYIGYSSQMQEGEVLSNMMTGIAELPFSPVSYELDATLNLDQTWTISAV